jgi:hypothetical protein
MYLVLFILTAFCGLLFPHNVYAAGTTAPNRKVTVYAWPLSAKSPTALAQISYTDSSSAHIDSYTAPKAVTADEIVRVGLYDKSTKHWTGVATTAQSFEPGRSHKITLHVDAKKDVYHVGFSATAAQDGAQTDAVVQVLEIAEGPQPVLNKPVVVSEDGKVPQKEEEKSFLQK